MRSFLVLIFLSIIILPLAALSYRQASQRSSYTLQTGPGSLSNNLATAGSSCVVGLSPPLHFTLLVPTSNPVRRAFAATIQQNLQCLGMNVSRVELPFSPDIYDRALVPPAGNLGKTFDQGGFDVLFVGYNIGIDPDPWSLYSSTQFAPYGQNYYLWNNTQNDILTNLVKTTLSATARDNYARQWQVLAYNELPSIPIFYDRGVVAFDSKFPNAQSVFNVYHYPAWPTVEHLSSNPVDGSFILAEPGQAPGQGVIPELSTSYYNLALSGEIFSSLAIRNDTIFKTMIPDLAAGTPTAPGWSVASDNKTWTVNLRTGVTWQDGQPFTANDVKFTFDLLQNDTFGSPLESFVKNIVGGISNVTITNPTQVVFHLPAPYAFFVQNILGAAGILPQHILSSFSKDYSKIIGSLFNRPDIGSSAVSNSLPIGTGPYKYVSWDSPTTTSHLMRNDNYFNFSDWGAGALKAKGQFQIKDYYVRTIVGSDAAITALTNGEVDFLDSQYHLETQPIFLSTWGSSRESAYDDFGVQEMGVNMEHPMLGTGTATPYAQAHPGDASAAASAARWIRQAISYATPRDQIINQLLNGYGVPAITSPIVGDYRTGFAVTEGFNTALQPYAFNLTRASELLQLAGYQTVTPPTVKITSVSPTAVNIGQPVRVGFAVSSTISVSAITIDWGDGTVSHPSPSSTSDSHVYLTSKSLQSYTFTINVTATSTGGVGFATTTEVVNDQPPVLAITSLSPSPAYQGQKVTLNFTATDPYDTVTETWTDWGDGSSPDLLLNMTSSSMCPRVSSGLSDSCAIAPGDLILAQSQDPSTIANGTIIVFALPYSPNFIIVHRVVGIVPPSTSAYYQYSFKTQGDANILPDCFSQYCYIPASWVVAVYNQTLTPSKAVPGERYDTHSYPSLGDAASKSYTIRINATDVNGLAAHLTTTATINDRPPIAAVTSLSPITTVIGSPVTLTFSASDPDGTVQSISINWGDGSNSTLSGSLRSSSHVYNFAGTFIVGVIASDNAGSRSATSTSTVTVSAPASPVAPASTILGLTPELFYVFVGAAIAILAAAIVVVRIRRKRLTE